MNPRISLLYLIIVMSTVPCSVFAVQGDIDNEKPILVFDRLGQSNAHQQATRLITAVYRELGYQLNYQAIPLGRSYVEAKKGNLDGLQGRVDRQSDKYPSLIKINVPIIKFSVVLIADRLLCGDCEIDQLNHVGTVKGFAALEQFLGENELHFEPIYLTDRASVERMFTAHRIEAQIVSDVLVDPVYFAEHERYRVHILCHRQTFHYLHKKHEHLAPSVESLLKTLKPRYQVDTFITVAQNTVFNAVEQNVKC